MSIMERSEARSAPDSSAASSTATTAATAATWKSTLMRPEMAFSSTGSGRASRRMRPSLSAAAA